MKVLFNAAIIALCTDFATLAKLTNVGALFVVIMVAGVNLEALCTSHQQRAEHLQGVHWTLHSTSSPCRLLYWYVPVLEASVLGQIFGD